MAGLDRIPPVGVPPEKVSREKRLMERECSPPVPALQVEVHNEKSLKMKMLSLAVHFRADLSTNVSIMSTKNLRNP